MCGMVEGGRLEVWLGYVGWAGLVGSGLVVGAISQT